jgi:hypothetical protein
MTDSTTPRTRRSRSTPKTETPPPAKASTQSPIIAPETISAILDWLSVVDTWSLAGHQNMFPRWVYVVLALFLLS